MKVINKLPKFMPGQVIDLSYKYKGLPNRLLVKSVFTREQDNSWMYDVYLENLGEYTTVNEEFIIGNMTNKDMKVYKCTEIIKLYNDGWRYCGNFSITEAHNTACKLATNPHIKNVIIRHALDGRGCLKNGMHSIWIRYYNVINDDGTINNTTCEDKDTIIIK